jgi:hypothetical protein
MPMVSPIVSRSLIIALKLLAFIFRNPYMMIWNISDQFRHHGKQKVHIWNHLGGIHSAIQQFLQRAIFHLMYHYTSFLILPTQL